MTNTPSNQRKDSSRMKAILVAVATIAFATGPFWNDGFGGFDPEAFPVPLDNPAVQPSGYVFAIWGLIYIWLLLSSGYGLLARAENNDWDRTRWWLLTSLAIGAPWISVANASPVWATVMILAMLITAVRALWQTPFSDRWLLRLPLSMYAGWLTVASGVAAGVLMTGYGLEQWAVLGLIGALLVGLVVLMALDGAPFYGAAIAWGLIGVSVKNFGTGDYVMAVSALVAVFLVMAFAIRSELRFPYVSFSSR